MADGESETQGKLAVEFSSMCNVREVNKTLVKALVDKMHEILRNNIEASCSSGIDSVHRYTKSSDDAKRYRELGTDLFKKKDYRQSIRKYTKCIAAAPTGCEHLASAYAGRSAALFDLGEYEASLLDANRALREGCSKSMTKLLRRRKVDCLKLRRAEGVEASKINIDALDPADLRRAKNLIDSERRVFVADRVFESQNPLLPNMSSKVEFVFEKESYPTLIAKEDIDAGDFLSIQEFSIMCSVAKMRIHRCAYCLGRCDFLIPCPSCSWMMFCCEFCRSEADKRFHRTECQLLQLYTHEGGNEHVIALRIFFMATNQGQALTDLMKTLKFDDIFRRKPSSPKVPFINDYCSEFDIMHKMELLNNENLLNIIEDTLPLAISEIIALRSISFFGTTSQSKSFNGIELFSILLLAKNHLLIWTNTIFAQTLKTSCEEHRIGCGLYFEHFFVPSCNPNTSAFVESRQRVAYATRSIKAGEQLSFNYRHVYMYTSFEERTDEFAKRSFNCPCEACLNQWPTADELKTREIEFLNDSTGTSAALITSIRGLIQDNHLEKDTDVFEALTNLIELLCSSLKMPSFEIFICEQLLIRCMDSFYSDFHWSVDPADLEDIFVRTCEMIMECLDQGKNQIPSVTQV